MTDDKERSSMNNFRPLSLTDRRASTAHIEKDGDMSPSRALTVEINDEHNIPMPQRLEKIQSRPRGPPTPNITTPSADLQSPTHSSHDPPPPPTPAASPGPDHLQPDWSDAGESEDIFLSQIRIYFKQSSAPERTRILGDLLNLCTSQQLSFVHQYVSPLLKKDPFTSLPDEICLRVWLLTLDMKPRLIISYRFYHLSTTRKYLRAHPKSRNAGEISLPMKSPG